MSEIHVIDLHFQEEAHSIGAFLIETSEGPILIESGPESTWNYLEKGILDLGYKIADIRHVLLTHIHFDHAGAAWKFAEQGAKIYVHPIGLPHLANPEKLLNSATQIFGDQMDKLWGKMEAIPEAQLIATEEGDQIQIGDTNIITWYTPGHAIHHNAYQINDTLFTGDVAGVKIDKGIVVPPCPLPDINIELWKTSIEKLKKLNAKELYLTHFARNDNPAQLFHDLELMLDDWSNFILPYYEKKATVEETVPLFMEYTQNQLRKAGLGDKEIQTYEYANPSWMSVTGLFRYWKLKEQGRI